MRILLISPQTPDTFGVSSTFLDLFPKGGISTAGFAHGGGMLPRDWELQVVDLNVERLKDSDLRRRIT